MLETGFPLMTTLWQDQKFATPKFDLLNSRHELSMECDNRDVEVLHAMKQCCITIVKRYWCRVSSLLCCDDGVYSLNPAISLHISHLYCFDFPQNWRISKNFAKFFAKSVCKACFLIIPVSKFNTPEFLSSSLKKSALTQNCVIRSYLPAVAATLHSPPAARMKLRVSNFKLGPFLFVLPERCSFEVGGGQRMKVKPFLFPDLRRFRGFSFA